MREITPLQAMYIGALRTKDRTVHVLDCNVNVAHILVMNADLPGELRRVYVSPTGKPLATFKYQPVLDRASVVA